jgi:hypothetical protein
MRGLILFSLVLGLPLASQSLGKPASTLVHAGNLWFQESDVMLMYLSNHDDGGSRGRILHVFLRCAGSPGYRELALEGSMTADELGRIWEKTANTATKLTRLANLMFLESDISAIYSSEHANASPKKQAVHVFLKTPSGPHEIALEGSIAQDELAGVIAGMQKEARP